MHSSITQPDAPLIDMHFSKVALLAAATAVSAQRPEDEPICDYYTTALLKNNTAENQATLLTLLVNTVVIGNCESASSEMMMMPSKTAC